MDLNEIKEIIESEGGKFIIVENGKPVMVVASFEDYKKRIKPTVRPLFPHSTQKNNPKAKEEKPLLKELQEEELKLEDLPF